MAKKQKKSIYIITVLLFAMAMPFQLQASPGKLQSGSICTKDGITYGSHGDGHWHRAAQRGNGWYSQGENLGYGNPCERTNTYSFKGSSRETETRKATPKKKRKAPKLTVAKPKLTKFSPEVKKELTNEELVALFGAKAEDPKDGDLSFHIIAAEQKAIPLNNGNQKYDITFRVMNSAGVITDQKVTLEVKKRNLPVLSTFKEATYKRVPTCKDVLEQQDLVVKDYDGNQVNLTCEHIQIDNSNNQAIINAVDQYGLSAKLLVPYQLAPRKVVKMSAIYALFAIIVAGGLLWSWRHKKQL